MSTIENKWYITATLLAGPPDHNQRTLWRGDTLIWRWNENMDEFPEWKAEALERVAAELNLVEEPWPTK